MRKLIHGFLLFLVIFSLTACGQGTASAQDSSEEQNQLIDRIYIKNTSDDVFDFSYLVFYKDNTFQGIKSKDMGRDEETGERTYSYSNTFGTYEIDKNSVMIHLLPEIFLHFGLDFLFADSLVRITLVPLTTGAIQSGLALQNLWTAAQSQTEIFRMLSTTI